MKNHSRIFAIALGISTAIPASAAVPSRSGIENLGTVDVSGQPDRDVVYNRFGGAIESLQLRASDSDVNCRSVTAKFGNGRSRQIFSGRLVEGRAINVDMPGDARHVSSLTFNCRAEERWGGKVRILADIGQNRAEWMRSPDWPRVWSQLFSGGNDNRPDGRGDAMRARNGPDRGTWTVIGEERFEARGDREVASAGWRGNDIRAIALMPVEADAQCRRVRADFERGASQDLDIGERLRRGQYNRVDLPGNRRDVVKLNMNCHAEGASNVTIRIYGQR